MTLTFNREVIISAGLPIIGEITVEAELEDGRLYLTATGFEPETPVPGLLWSAVEGPCDAWLAQNRSRIERKALKEIDRMIEYMFLHNPLSVKRFEANPEEL